MTHSQPIQSKKSASAAACRRSHAAAAMHFALGFGCRATGCAATDLSGPWGLAGLRPEGNPLIGSPSAQRPTGTLGLPFLIFWDQ